MWNGRWSKELDVLYDQYYILFGIEPDCGMDFNFDDISYSEYVRRLRRSILLKKQIEL